MPRLIDWIDDRKKSTVVLIGLLVLAYSVAFLLPGIPWIAQTSLVASIVCPFALFLVWVVDSPWSDKLLARRWTAILYAGVVIVYGMFANTFASDLINGYFRVDPVHFTVTNIFLTVAYLLIGVFQPFVMFPLWISVVLLGGLVFPALLIIGPAKQAFKRIGFFILGAVLISASTTSLGLLTHNLPLLAERVALAADFNEKHRCTAPWTVAVDKVVFLADGNVLAHIQGTRNYAVLPCVPR